MECTDYIKRFNELYFEATSNLLDIGSEYKNDIDPTELAACKASMANIETKTSISNAALYTWKVTNSPAPIKASPSQSQATSNIGTNQAHELKEVNEKAKATYKHIMMDYDALKEKGSQYGNHMVVQDHVIIKGMKMRDPWKKQMKRSQRTSKMSQP